MNTLQRDIEKAKNAVIVRHLKARIAKGVAYLNKQKKGWYKTINLSKLNLSYSTVCVLGQAFDDYWKVVRGGRDQGKDKMPQKTAESMGFVLPDTPELYDDLTRLWHAKIVALRKRR